MSTKVTAEGLMWLEKDKDSTLNYSFKLDGVLASNDEISSVSWEVAPAGSVVISEVTYQDREIIAVISGGVENTWYSVKFRWTSLSGLSADFVLRVFVQQDAEDTFGVPGSDLFPNRFTATEALRRDRLMMAARTVLAGTSTFTDDYVWGKLVTAESELKHILRVQFTPTRFMPKEPTADELAALGSMPWAIDPGYEYEPDFFQGDKWGFLQLRQRPLVSVESVRIRFPGNSSATAYSIPSDWFRMDRKYAQVQFVPGSEGGSMPLNAFMMQALGAGRRVPFSIEAVYTAGLSNVATAFPELIDAVKKRAVLSMLEDAFLPTSGSISGDGLSQSLSMDMDKYRDTVDHVIHGAKGRNGGLMAAIHGIRLGVL